MDIGHYFQVIISWTNLGKRNKIIDMNYRIGIFDSGHGGLDILQYLASRHSKWSFKYIADLGFMPYGNKSIELIQQRCLTISELLIEQGCDAIIVACNTATAVAIDKMRESFDLPIIGIEPYVNYINKAPQEDFRSGHLGALVTANTGQSERFKKLKERLDPNNLVKVEVIQKLAPLVEELIAKQYLDTFKDKLKEVLTPVRPYAWKEVILGCTHYPLISEFISEELQCKCISPTENVATQLEVRLGVETSALSSKEAKGIYQDCLFDYLNTAQNGVWHEYKMSSLLFWRYS